MLWNVYELEVNEPIVGDGYVIDGQTKVATIEFDEDATNQDILDLLCKSGVFPDNHMELFIFEWVDCDFCVVYAEADDMPLINIELAKEGN